MQLKFLKSFWTWSSGAPKFAHVAGTNAAWLRQQGCLSQLRNIEKERMLVWFKMFPTDLAKRRRQNNVKRIINNIQVHMWTSTQLRNCECSHLLTSFGRMLGSMLDLNHKYRLVMGWY